MSSIYDRQRLNARQLVTVAQRRFEDAEALCDTGKNKHANGAQYLGGFVIELLLKAQMLRRFDKLGPVERVTTWTIFARYSPRTTTVADARDWLARVRSLKEVLK